MPAQRRIVRDTLQSGQAMPGESCPLISRREFCCPPAFFQLPSRQHQRCSEDSAINLNPRSTKEQIARVANKILQQKRRSHVRQSRRSGRNLTGPAGKNPSLQCHLHHPIRGTPARRNSHLYRIPGGSLRAHGTGKGRHPLRAVGESG